MIVKRAILLMVGACVAIQGMPGVAHAQDPATAQRLFTEGRALLEKGDVPTACARFEESRSLDPSAVGTLLNLAICNERRGRLASAWLQLNEVVSASRATRPDRVALADERIRAIEPRLTKLAVMVPPESQVPGLTVSVDGKPRPASSYGVPIAIDGGEHVITASAKGHANFITKVSAPVEKGSLQVAIPVLEAVAEEAAPLPPPGPESLPAYAAPDVTPKATLGWVMAAGGIAVMAVGAGFGISVLTDMPRYNDKPERYRYDQINLNAWIANIALPIGALLTGAGAYLVFTNTKRAPAAAPPALTDSASLRGRPTVLAGPRDIRLGWEASF